MAQEQMLFTEDTLAYFNSFGLNNVCWSPVCKEIITELPDRYILNLKKNTKRNQVVSKGQQKITIPFEIFDLFCHLKESVQLLSSFLGEQ